MKKTVTLSLVATSMLFANSSNLGTIEVESVAPTAVAYDDISGEELKSADLAEALSKANANISLVRGSGIANDIILRGQKKDNINVLIDGAKIYGACPNRMDPPTSHIETNNVANVAVVEGPYDVKNFGTLSGLVTVETKKPTKEFSGDINLNVGSFGYKKASATASGGMDNFRILVGGSYEESDQYEDGDGKTFAQQLDAVAPAGNRYKDSKKDAKAYEKKTFMVKTYFDIGDNHEVKLGYKRAESDGVLYPSRPMDAVYDDSNMYTLGYSAYDLGRFSQILDIELYKTDVDHPMDTAYRNVSATAAPGIVTNHLETDVRGGKISNEFNLADIDFTVGLDTSTRNWDGKYSASNTANPINGRESINDTDTKNNAIFATAQRKINDFILQGGMRVDDTRIEHGGMEKDNDYDSFNANAMLTYLLDANSEVFIGAGKSSRVPDARELYFKNNQGGLVGNPNLDQTKNYEANLGYSINYGSGNVKVKTFYSQLKDYIYNQGGLNAFTNIDATIYGFDVAGSHTLVENLTLDYALAYLKGKKDEAIEGQSDTDLAEIPPLKANLGLSYAFTNATLSTEVVAQKAWSSYDEDNGEQRLAGYGIVNVKYNHIVHKNIDVTVGVDNVFDKTYAATNTYNDVNLVGDMTTDNSFLINEPGRYAYLNLRYSF
ncbi:MAG: TonB-dependent receptor [Campylobacterota bacterium]